MTAGTVPVHCACGAFRAALRVASPGAGNRVVCYCDDCQAFARFLGRAESILDGHGGTDIFQTSPADLVLEQGIDRLSCMQLRPGGLLRWYTLCCRSPLGNTLGTRQLPFLGLILPHDGAGPARDGRFGPVRGRVHGRFAVGERSRLGAHDGVPLAQILRIVRLLATWRLRGDHRRSPLFDPSGAPLAAPRVLSSDELRALAPARAATGPERGAG